MDQAITQLKQLVEHASQPGNLTNDYMLGMANGLILALGILENKAPNYLARHLIAGHVASDDK
jgi:hypothetical protein